jgi:hypothetical protein
MRVEVLDRELGPSLDDREAGSEYFGVHGAN